MKKIKLYTKDYCGFCNRAKKLLDDNGYEYEFEEIQDKPEVQEELIAKYGQESVPYVFIGDELIGGNSDLQKLFADGKLDEMLAD